MTLYDEIAERTVAACAALSTTAALAATDRLRPEHFHDPRCWAVIEASISVPNERPDGVDPDEGWWREHAVADAAGIYRAQLEEWCRHAVMAWDIDGRMADRVLAAAERRHAADVHVAALEELGITVRWKAQVA